jgi:hypothetical protein
MRHVTVKGGIEAGNLDGPREDTRRRLYRNDRLREVLGIYCREVSQLYQQAVGDKLRGRVMRSAMDDAMPNGSRRFMAQIAYLTGDVEKGALKSTGRYAPLEYFGSVR